MLLKQLLISFILLLFINCSVNSPDSKIDSNQFPSGFHIENGPRQGFQYFDSTNKQYNYRYYTITVANDTSVSAWLKIKLPNVDEKLNVKHKTNFFLLPRHLTPKKQEFDKSISAELKRFLDYERHKPEEVNKLLQPFEKYVLTFGFLTETEFPDIDPTTPYGTKLLISDEFSSSKLIDLQINDSIKIKCGQLFYTKPK